MLEGLWFLLFGLTLFLPVPEILLQVLALIIGLLWAFGIVRSRGK
jgi:hypothetical protein